MDKAFRLAESGQPGPVLVDVPMDVFSQPLDPRLFARIAGNTRVLRRRRSTTRPPGPSSPGWPRAERPVLYAGGGVLLARASDELARFVDHMAIRWPTA
jgi:acetolactate synthase-1/2/3 large subunit